MRFCLIHVHAEAAPGEEAAVLVPGGSKTVAMVPLAAVGTLLATLAADAAPDDQPPPCGGCGEPLPGRGQHVTRLN